MSVVFDSAADVAQQQDNKRLNNANWKKSLQHKQRLGVLDDGGVEVLGRPVALTPTVEVEWSLAPQDQLPLSLQV